jgi:hypothetical protein
LDPIPGVADGVETAGIRPDQVAADRVPVSVPQDEPIPTVAADDVSFVSGVAAHRVVRRTAVDGYATPTVPHSGGAGHVDPNVVAADDVVTGAIAHGQTIALVAADDVAIRGRRSSDGVIAAVEHEPCSLIRQGLAATGVEADEVACKDAG